MWTLITFTICNFDHGTNNEMLLSVLSRNYHGTSVYRRSVPTKQHAMTRGVPRVSCRHIATVREIETQCCGQRKYDVVTTTEKVSLVLHQLVS